MRDRLPAFARMTRLSLALLVVTSAGSILEAGCFCRGAEPPQMQGCRDPRFSFTDAAALPDGRLVFLAVAEDSPDTFRDGEVVGVRVGLIEAERVVTAEIVDEAGAPSRLKLEGVELERVGEDGTLELLVVADVDDPDVPSVIATLTWRP